MPPSIHFNDYPFVFVLVAVTMYMGTVHALEMTRPLHVWTKFFIEVNSFELNKMHHWMLVA